MNGKIFLHGITGIKRNRFFGPAVFTFFALLAFFEFSCASIDVELEPEFKGADPRRSPSEIEISYSAPNAAYEQIGRIWIYYQSGYDRDWAMKKLRKKAAKAGADGIILEKTHSMREDWMVKHEGGGSQPAQWNIVSFQMKGQMYRYTKANDAGENRGIMK